MQSLDTMAPWDALAWFDLPAQTDIIASGNPGQILVGADQRRVVLAVGASSFAAINLSLLPNVDAAHGHSLSGGQPMWIITQAQHGPLVAQQWFMFAPVTTVVSVIEVKLRDWPRPGSTQSGPLAQVAPAADNRFRRLLRRAIGRT